MTPGWIHVITGCMFSGKTDELLRLLRRAEIAGRRIILVRPTVDDRTPPSSVESRSGVAFAARAVRGSSDIPAVVSAERASVVAIDEAQFFDAQLPWSARSSPTRVAASWSPGWTGTSWADRSGLCQRSSRSPTR